MKVKLDFTLSRQFGVVEKTVFGLVLNGVTNTLQIRKLLWVFSDEVIANTFRRLVNQQILHADLDSQTIFLSDSVQAIIVKCTNDSYDIEIPESLTTIMTDGILFIDNTKVKEEILAQLLPGIKLGNLVNLIDFVISKRSQCDE